MDLVRYALLQVEEGFHEPQQVEGFSSNEILGHFELLIDAGFIDGKVVHASGGEIAFVHMSKLSWAGHDLLSSMKNPQVYEPVKTKILKAGGSWTLDILKTLLSAELAKHLGLQSS